MVAVRIFLEDDQVGAKFQRGALRAHNAVVSAARAAAQNVADQILQDGREDITASGRFGTRWTQGLHADVTEEGDNITIGIRHDVPYFNVFEFGAIIHGKPLLWIPLPGVDPDERGDFFQTSRKGNLLLFKKSGSKEIVPLRVAKESVTIPKKFRIREIARLAAGRLGSLFSARMKDEQGKG
jgi:hypothetical protein